MSAAPRDVLTLARGLLARAEPEMVGLWPRATALLAHRALEAAVERVWERRALDLRGCAKRVQIICLRSYLGDVDLAARAAHAWTALGRACHHHPYELAPTATELRGWIAVVEELVAKAD